MRGAQGYRDRDRGPIRGASRSRSMRRSASFSLSPRPRSDSRSPLPAADLRPPPVATRRRRKKRTQQLPSASRSPPPKPSAQPRVKRDAFGRSTAQRRKYGEKSFSSEDAGGPQRGSESRSSSPGAGKGMPIPGWPGMFPMAMGGKGFPFPGMMDPAAMWEASKQWANGMQGASFPMPWAGLAAKGDWSRSSAREPSRSRSRRRPANRSRSRSGGRVTDSISVPKSIMGRVIGKQGATIKEIREASGARVDAEDVSDERCEFKIQGTPESIEIAKRMIRDVVDKTATGPGLDPNDNDANTTTMILEFPAAATGRIIGARGVKIAEVRHSSGAKVQIDKQDEKCKVHMSGTPEQLERAKVLVSKLAEEIDENFGKPGEGDDPVNEYVEFPAGATGAIIGTRGSKIAELRQKSGAKLQVEKLEDRCKVLLSGTREAVDRAKELCRICVEESQARMAAGAGRQAHGNLEETMDVPQSMVGRVIGKGGETIQRIQKECGARLDVDTQCGDPCRVMIRGNQESVCHARFLISEVLDKGNLNSDGGSSSQGQGFWPDASYGFGGSPGYPSDYADPWAMYGQMGSHSGADHGEFKSLVDKNEIDMDEL